MSYTVAALAGVAGTVLVDLFVLRTRLVLRPVFWVTYPIIVGFQLASNGILTGRGIVRYDPDAIIGLRLVHAPVEDLLFGFALVLLTLAAWVWLGRRGVQPTPTAGEGGVLPRRLGRGRHGDAGGRGDSGRPADPGAHEDRATGDRPDPARG